MISSTFFVDGNGERINMVVTFLWQPGIKIPFLPFLAYSPETRESSIVAAIIRDWTAFDGVEPNSAETISFFS